ncbi:pinin isoform X2 [Phlebotomus papatasi]|uniref:pinin isoform X2 n=1 Tax=Phlebotomus papatasi TaxID=29031 RepID=UPI0024839616|nr:pinin isoform X2 [Phlebotomus papatasi]XP_055705365.1 pinin isoform X2 [Phlebotomus papatasi]
MQEDQIIEVEVVSIDPDFDFGSPGREDVHETFYEEEEDDPNVEVMNILAQVNESIQEENARIERSLVENASSPQKRVHKKSFSLPASPTFVLPDDMNLSISLDDINIDGDLDTSLNEKADDFNLLEWVQEDEEKKIRKTKKTKHSRGKDLNLMRAELEKESKKDTKKESKKSKTSSSKKSQLRPRKKAQQETESEENVDIITVSPNAKHRIQSDPTWCPSRSTATKAPPKATGEKVRQNRGKNDLNSMKMKFLAANPIPTGFKKRKQPQQSVKRPLEMDDHDYCTPRRRQIAASKVSQDEKCHRNVLEILEEKKPPGAIDRSWRMGNGDMMTYVVKEEIVETENTQKSTKSQDVGHSLGAGKSLLKPLNQRIEKPPESVKNMENPINSLRSIRKELQKQPPSEDSKPSVTYRDPILVAKEKALRIREKKRAAALKLMDEEVKVKSVPLMPILPLAEMTGMRLHEDTEKSQQLQTQELKTTHLANEYEEIVIVSIGCNTEISIPPETESASNLLHQSSLFSNITETIIKTTPISSNSLLFSIQDMMMKKRNPGITSPRCAVSPPNGASPDKPEGANGTPAPSIVPAKEHGEDKVIMHLRKDRIRPTTVTISIQTERHGEFSPILSRKHGQRRRSLSTDSSSSSTSSSSSSSSTSTSSTNTERSYKFSSHRRRHYRSRSRSRTTRRSYRSPSGSSRSPSPCSKRSRSRDPRSRSRDTRSRSYDRRSRSHERRSRSRDCRMSQRSRNPRKTSPERRIVYVGKLEEDLTKDDLKRKFQSYGPITKVTLHFKEVTRMRYGFVTFERARDAYEAIDNGPKNPNLNCYDISFGGRRAFCRSSYSDLDNVAGGFYGSRDYYRLPMDVPGPSVSGRSMSNAYESFDALLQSFTKRKIKP